MIQDALSAAMKHAVAVPLPSDLSWLAEAVGGKHAKFRETLRSVLDQVDRDLAAMKACGAVIREGMLLAFSSDKVLPHHLDVLTWLIEALEAYAEKESDDAARRFKRIRKATKRIESKEPGLRPLLEELSATVRAQSREEIDERLDFALFLRALRAEHRPPSPPVASFTEAPAMVEFLKAELGA